MDTRVEYDVKAVVLFQDSPGPLTVKSEELQFSPFPPVEPSKVPFAEQTHDVGRFASSRLTGQQKWF